MPIVSYASRSVKSLLALVFACGLPATTQAEQFSIIAIPDTQAYLDHSGDTINGGNASRFFGQTTWIAGNIGAETIIYGTHLGDIVNTSDCNPADEHWATANDAMVTLDATNLPYGISPGNHDYDWSSGNTCEADEPTAKYNNGVTPAEDGVMRPGFGPARYVAQPFYGGSRLPGENDDNYILFQSPVTGVKFIGLNIGWSNSDMSVDGGLDAGESASIAADESAKLAWADARLKEFADRKAIVTSHEISGDRNSGSPCDDGPGTGGSGKTFSPFGQALYDELKDNPNLYMMLSGHCQGEHYFRMSGSTVPLDEGEQDPARACMNDVHVIMSNYQFSNTSSAPLRLMEIDTVANTVDISTISTAGGTSANNFTIAGMSTSTRTNFQIPWENEISPSGVILLPDTSGSMNWGVNAGDFSPAAGEARIDYAIQAGTTFVDLMFAAPSSLSVANIGLATFPDHPYVPGVASADQIVPLTLFSPAVRTNLNAQIAGLTIGGGTPMLEGLEEADLMLNAMQCKAVVLLSDGAHNVPNGVSVGHADLESTLTTLGAGTSDVTQVYAINFADAGQNHIDVLTEIANRTDPDSTVGDSAQYFDALTDIDGVSGVFSTGLGLTTVYQKILTRLLGLDFGLDPIDSIAFGETRSFYQSVNLHDRKVTFVVSWRPSEAPLTVDVYDSSGQVLSPLDDDVDLIDGGSYLIFSVAINSMNANSRIGPSPWRVDVSHRPSNPCPPTRVCKAITGGQISDQDVIFNDDVVIDDGQRQFYQYSSIIDSGLKLHARLDRGHYYVGNQVRMMAEVAEGRRTIRGLKEIEVLVTAPNEGFGNFFAENTVTAAQLAKIPTSIGDEALSPVMRKSLFLRDAGLSFPARLPQRHFTLYDDGTNGDQIADDGVYTNVFADTLKAGVYSFNFRVSGPTRHGNLFNREDLIQTNIQVRPFASAIGVDAVFTGDDNGRLFDIKVTPKDQLGNFVGPGFGGKIALEPSLGRFIGKLVDNIDGSYNQTLLLDAGDDEDDTNILLDVLGVKKGVNLGQVLGGGGPEPQICDVDGDEDVDIIDIRRIAARRRQKADGPDDPADWDDNGIIDLLDVRGCQRSCTLPRCAIVN